MSKNATVINRLKVTENLFNKAFALKLNLSMADAQVFRSNYLSDDNFNRWVDFLGSVDMSEMVSVNGNTLSLFHDSLRIKVSKKGIEVKTPRFKGDLYNEVLSNQYLENNLIGSLLGVNAENNIIGLLSLGILVNGGVKSDHIYLPHMKQEHVFFFLKTALTSNSEDFEILIQQVEDEKHVELLRKYNAYFSPIKQQFESLLRDGLVEIFGLEPSQKENLIFLAQQISKHCNLIELTSSPMAFEQDIAQMTPFLAQHMRIIESNEPALLHGYVTGLYKAADYSEPLEAFVAKTDDIIQAIERGEEVNYSKFYELTHAPHDYMYHVDNWLVDDIKLAIAKGFDPLKINYKAFGVVSLNRVNEIFTINESQSVNGFDLKKSIALLSKFWLAYSGGRDVVTEDELVEFARTIVLDLKERNLFSELIIEYMTTHDTANNYEANKVFAEHVLLKIIRTIKCKLIAYGNLNTLKANELFAINQYNIRPNMFSTFLFDCGKSFDKYCDAVSTDIEFLANIRKIITLAMIGELIKDSFGFGGREVVKPQHIKIGTEILTNVDSWTELHKLYSEKNIIDGFITSANFAYLKEMVTYGAIYTADSDEVVTVFTLEAVRSRLKASKTNGSDYVYDLHTVSSTGDLKPEYYQIGFMLKNELTGLIKSY